MIHVIFDREIKNRMGLLTFQMYKISDFMDCIQAFIGSLKTMMPLGSVLTLKISLCWHTKELSLYAGLGVLEETCRHLWTP